MATSQNGWSVLDGSFDGPFPRLRDWNVPDCNRKLPLRDGSAGFLLTHMAVWFNRNIEAIDRSVDDWGWSPRRISGSDLWSNHASGTAMDLNSDSHPQGHPASGSFSALEITGIHRRLLLYQGCLRWGGDFRTTVDSMHYEINQGPAEVTARAKYLCGRGAIGRAVLAANPGARKVIFA
jgi:hypothetical protein